ncbi:MAG TPA: isoprenylcysteine carboxylmethyltransferase family protein, partial [Dehalococcoidia bacterium]
MLTRIAICGYMATARLIELAYSQRNVTASGRSEEGSLSRRTYPLIVAVHTAVIGGTLVAGSRPRWGWLTALLALQPLRFWVLATLGRRWNTRGAVAPETEVEAGGPYAYVRHPNYTVVAGELFSLPAAFGLMPLACFATAVNGALIAVRIRDEEHLLSRLPGYREHFDAKPRFL